ncbi:MAG: tripartite tricarboxylate transporter substrate-binding protein [Pseudomonadota bacterium]
MALSFFSCRTANATASAMSSALEHVKAGALKAFAVGSQARDRRAPDVPTVTEAGVPGVEVSGWLGVMAPVGTPPAVVEKLHDAIELALDQPEVQATFSEMGADALPGTQAEFGRFIEEDFTKWQR